LNGNQALLVDGQIWSKWVSVTAQITLRNYALRSPPLMLSHDNIAKAGICSPMPASTDAHPAPVDDQEPEE